MMCNAFLKSAHITHSAQRLCNISENAAIIHKTGHHFIVSLLLNKLLLNTQQSVCIIIDKDLSLAIRRWSHESTDAERKFK